MALYGAADGKKRLDAQEDGAIDEWDMRQAGHC